jgi:hypothetical protein
MERNVDRDGNPAEEKDIARLINDHRRNFSSQIPRSVYRNFHPSFLYRAKNRLGPTVRVLGMIDRLEPKVCTVHWQICNGVLHINHGGQNEKVSHRRAKICPCEGSLACPGSCTDSLNSSAECAECTQCTRCSSSTGSLAMYEVCSELNAQGQLTSIRYTLRNGVKTNILGTGILSLTAFERTWLRSAI